MKLERTGLGSVGRVGWAFALVVPVLAGSTGPLWVGPAPDTPAHADVTHLSRPIPAFSRQYRTACSTCHTAAPKLNVLGEAFRLNGYRMPDNQLLLREDDPVSLGDEAWKDQWPRAIWPGDVPGQSPLAIRVQSDMQWTRDQAVDYDFTYRFPHEVYLLAGTNLGNSIGAFLESEWSREDGLQVIQAKFKFQDVIPGLAPRRANLWLGLQNPYLFSFADRQIDRAARQQFTWQEFRASDLRFVDPESGADVVSRNAFRLGWTQPSLELNGLLNSRLYYGVGLAQGTARQTADNNTAKDLYVKLRYKLGGLDLEGQYADGDGPVVGTGGQLLDHSLTLETFGYFGSQPAAQGVEDRTRSLGVALRALSGPWDAGIGFVHTHHDDPWGRDADGTLDYWSTFGKLEVLAYPWVIGSLKAEVFAAPVPENLRSDGFTIGERRRTTVLPGVVVLLRQNVRGIIEGEIFLRDTQSRELGRRRPHNLWVRLDVAF
ncbi:MAG: hypothetical protein R3E10_12635 [Gemmatimonadota bacterium]